MVKEEWSVVKCSNCEKINKVPGKEKEADAQIKMNNNMNHFDLQLPYVVK